jgi:hypothetical protein
MVFVLNEAMLGCLDVMHPCHFSEMYKRCSYDICSFFCSLWKYQLEVLETGIRLSACNSGKRGSMNGTLKVNTDNYLPNFWTFLDLGS